MFAPLYVGAFASLPVPAFVDAVEFLPFPAARRTRSVFIRLLKQPNAMLELANPREKMAVDGLDKRNLTRRGGDVIPAW